MINLFSLSRVIAVLAAAYAVFPIAFLYFTWPATGSRTLASVLLTAFAGTGTFTFVLFVLFNFAWRWIWRLFPRLNTAVFPDLNGYWDMRIEWNRDGRHGVKKARAVIKQSFLKLSMEVHSEDSDSETYLAQPKKDPESGEPRLHYIFKVVPKHVAGQEALPAYDGCARLRYSSRNPLGLQGNYFTNAGSHGMFELIR